jgi:hypothetical protein
MAALSFPFCRLAITELQSQRLLETVTDTKPGIGSNLSQVVVLKGLRFKLIFRVASSQPINSLIIQRLKAHSSSFSHGLSQSSRGCSQEPLLRPGLKLSFSITVRFFVIGIPPSNSPVERARRAIRYGTRKGSTLNSYSQRAKVNDTRDTDSLTD